MTGTITSEVHIYEKMTQSIQIQIPVNGTQIMTSGMNSASTSGINSGSTSGMNSGATSSLSFNTRNLMILSLFLFLVV